MGTGVGGGIVINGKLHVGRTNIAGEWGVIIHYIAMEIHAIVERRCVEAYISGPALEKKWKSLSGESKICA